MRTTPYDPIKDFLPVTITNMQSNVLVVHPSIGVNSIKDLISSAKSRPGGLNYATTGAGSSSHLAAELFNAMAGVKIVRVNYTSTATMMADLMGNQVQLNFGVAGAVTPHVKSGRLKALAVTSIAPSPLFPELPTVAATVSGYQAVAILGHIRTRQNAGWADRPSQPRDRARHPAARDQGKIVRCRHRAGRQFTA